MEPISVQAVVFDLDNTLYDERQFAAGGIRAVSDHLEARFGVNGAQARWLMGAVREHLGRKAMLEETVHLFGLPPGLLPELVGVYRRHRPQLALYEGYQSILTGLRSRYRLGLITDGLPEVQQRKVAALQLQDLLDAVVYGWEEGAACGKPSPRPFFRLAERIGVPARQAIYVGDNPAKDFFGARTAGMGTVRVLTGPHRNDTPQPGYEPDYVIESLRLLPGLLKRQFDCRVDPETRAAFTRSGAA